MFKKTLKTVAKANGLIKSDLMSLSFPRSMVILPFRCGIASLGVRSNFPSSTVSSLELRCFSLQVRSSFPLKYGRVLHRVQWLFPRSTVSIPLQCPPPRINLKSPSTWHFFFPPAVVRWVSSRPFHPEVAQATPALRDSSDESVLVRGGFARIRKTACLRF